MWSVEALIMPRRGGEVGLTGQEPRPAHRLAGVRRCDAPYSSRRAPRGLGRASFEVRSWERGHATLEGKCGEAVRVETILAGFRSRAAERFITRDFRPG